MKKIDATKYDHKRLNCKFKQVKQIHHLQLVQR